MAASGRRGAHRVDDPLRRHRRHLDRGLNELERRGDHDQAAGYTRALGVHLTINGLWSLVYFRWHNLPAATVGAGVLALNSWLLARRAGLVDRKFGLQHTPYALWTSFATALTGSMWSRNPRKS